MDFDLPGMIPMGDSERRITIGSLFSGIGGLELGLELAGLGPTLWQIENSSFCRSVLARHWPDADRFDDVCSVGASELANVDLICGGFPCQDVSAAGKGAGLDGARSGLWREFRRIVSELHPAWVVVENVASGAKRWLEPVCADLEGLGYEVLPIPLAAADVGAPHLRRRLFLVAHANGQGELQQKGIKQDKRGWFGDGSALVADTDLPGLEVRQFEQARRQQQTAKRGSLHDKPWTTEPDVGRMAHGVPARMDRLKALGNAVVPQCAEVVGWVIREMIYSMKVPHHTKFTPEQLAQLLYVEFYADAWGDIDPELFKAVGVGDLSRPHADMLRAALDRVVARLVNQNR